MRNYKYRICCKETAQPIGDYSYSHLPSKPINDEAAGDRRGTRSSLVGGPLFYSVGEF